MLVSRALLAAVAAVAAGCAIHTAPPAPEPAIDGRCSGEPGVCLLGVPAPLEEGGETAGWRCLGLHGGADAACVLPAPALPPPVAAVAGAPPAAAVAQAAGAAPRPRRVAAAQAAAGQEPVAARAQAQIAALLAAKAQRTPAQRKVGSRLLALAAQETLRGPPQPLPLDPEPPAEPLPDEGRAADDRVLVDIRADVTAEVLARIRRLGGTVINSVPRYRAIRAQLPLAALESLAALDAVRTIRPADEAQTRGQTAALGPAFGSSASDATATRKADTSEGDAAHGAAAARRTYGVDGSGVGIGVLSNGVQTLAKRQASGDLPARVTVLPGQAGTGDEGTAMLEIVHDLAPGAELYFATAYGGQARFAANIEALCDAGADVIVDDVYYYHEAVLQDGTIAQGVNAATADGCFYFSAAGNDGNLNDGTSTVWEGDYAAGSALVDGRDTLGVRHDFGGGVEENVWSVPGPSRAGVVLQWADPLGASANDYDLFVVDEDGNVTNSSTNTQDGTQDPIEFISFISLRAQEARLVVVKASGADRYLRLQPFQGQIAVTTAGNTFGHAAAENALGVGAVNVRTAAGAGGVFDGTESAEWFSSDGPRRIFFESDGTPITAADFSATGGKALQKPDFVAANRVSTATPGFSTFAGTSAAAPHGAAIAALVIEGAGGPANVTLAALRTALAGSALDIEATGVDRDSGAGIVMAPAAVDAVDVAAANRNGAPTVVAAPADRTLAQGAAATVDVASTFEDPNDDTLTYTVRSGNPGAVSVALAGTGITVTALAPGRVTVLVRATDPGGLSTVTAFEVTVSYGNRDYDADDDGLVEVATLAQLDAMRYDLDGDGLVADELDSAAYYTAFFAGALGMGCPAACSGYELTADLDFDTNGSGGADAGDTYWNDGAGWMPIGEIAIFHDARFTATFEGNGRTVSNLFIDRERWQLGLFGAVSPSAVIRHVGLIDVDVTGNEAYAGGLAGINHGAIADSYATGRVSGTIAVGGLVGSSAGSITGSYATVRVTGRHDLGGLVGMTSGSAEIRASYATGSVSGRSDGLDAGGLVGRHFGHLIAASYATGRVSGGRSVGGLVGSVTSVFGPLHSRIRHSYWDLDTSGMSVGALGPYRDEQRPWPGVEGRRTAALQAPTGYEGIYAEWNLDLDGDGVADNPWRFGTSGQYPVLAADLNRDAQATWREFGHQVRAGPTLTATAPAGQARVDLSWTAVDVSHWTPAPDVTYTLTRDDGAAVETVAENLGVPRHADTGVAVGTAYTYQVAAVVRGGEVVRSARVSVVAGAANQPPAAVGLLADVTLRVGGAAAVVDVAGGFEDRNGDTLTYSASSGSTAVATATVSGSRVTITPVWTGRAMVTVTATDTAGSNTTATQYFMVTVAAGGSIDYDTDDDGLIEITKLAQLDAVRHDLGGRGLPTAEGAAAYAAAFPEAGDRMGCGLDGCSGYELIADLDFDTNGSGGADAGDAYWNGGAGWMPIGSRGTSSNPFGATFEGNGHTVANLFIDRSERRQGLFGYTGSYLGSPQRGVIRNVGLVDVDVTGDDFVGGLVGDNWGEVTGSYVTGRVAGADRVGGLAGRNRRRIAASYASAGVAGTSYVGGLVGSNWWDGEILAGYATGRVSATSVAGGLAGDNWHQSEIHASYATGRVSATSNVGGLVGDDSAILTASYWDTTTSGQTTGAGGEGRTTAALQAPAGYTGIYSSWSVDLDGDGVNDEPWDFGTTTQYPVLVVDFDGDGAATWQEFGRQLRAGPSLAATAKTTTPGRGQVDLTWTAVDSSHWTPAPDVTYTITRGDGATVELLAERVGGLQYADTGAVSAATYTYQVGAVAGGGEATRSALVEVTVPGNGPPVAVGTLPDRLLHVDDAPAVQVAGAFRDPENDALTYGVSSSATAVATVSLSGTRVTITAVAEGTATITVTATDLAGSTASAMQAFTVTVLPATVVDYDTDDDGLIEITTLAQLDAVRHDLDGDGAPTADGATAYAAAFVGAGERQVCGGAGCVGYELLADLDFDTNGNGRADAGDRYWNAGAGWVPLGDDDQSFQAIFEGNGHTLANLFIYATNEDLGLFRGTASSSVIRNLGLIHASVGWVGPYSGGLAAVNRGEIRASYVTGRVSGFETVGGLVGWNDGAIVGSYAAARVRGALGVPGWGWYGAGGLVGINSGSITASYAAGRVSGRNDVGGLVGTNQGDDSAITASYATGYVSGTGSNLAGLVGSDSGAIQVSYWDRTTSGRDTGTHGAGRTTAALQAPTGYSGIYSQWDVDLDGDSVNDDSWHFGTNAQYPALQVDFDGDGQATWQEFGRQLRAGPTLTATGGPGQVALSWTAVDASHWSPAPEVTYTLSRRRGASVTTVAEKIGGLTFTDTGLAGEIEYTYLVAAAAEGGEATRSAPVEVSVGNGPPLLIGALPDRWLHVGDAAAVKVAGAFRDQENDALTYTVSSSATSVATVSLSGTRVTITPVAEGTATITVTATDAGGSAASATQAFTVTVLPSTAVDYDTDDDGLVEITTLAQLDAVRHDLDGNGAPTADGATAYAAAFSAAGERQGCGGAGCAGYELVADLDFDTNGNGRADAGDTYWNAGAGWAPLGSQFSAIFEGNGHTLANLFIHATSEDYVGLFLWTTKSSVIRNVGVIDADVTGAGWDAGALEGTRNAGGLAGFNEGEIRASYVTGRVSGARRAGGLVGFNAGRIAGSYAAARVSGVEEAGGLAGRNTRTGFVLAGYATGSVSGAGDVGGLVGRSTNGTISFSYATGYVSGTGANVGGLVGNGVKYVFGYGAFWDTTTSGRNTGTHGLGRTTSALQAPTGYSSIYTSWNVDLDGDSVKDDPWHFGTNAQYPVLQVDFDGDGQATWQEFGRQLRAGPSLTATGGPAQVALNWTAADVSHWSPAPAVTYTLTRTDGDTVETVAEEVGGLAFTDTGLAGETEYSYQVAAVVAGGEATRGALVSAKTSNPSSGANQAPQAVGSLSALTLRIADGAATVDVSGAFQDPDNDVLTYGAASSSPAVATVSISSSTLTLTPLTAGESTLTVTATDAAGSNTSANQQFVVTVANRPPETVGTLSDRTLQVVDGAVTVDVSGAFRDLDGDALTYGAASSTPAVATVSVSSSTLTLTPLTAGVSTVTVTATDAAGSNTSATQRFVMTVELGGTVDYDADDDGLIEIATLAQLDAVRHDLDGEGAPTETGATAYAAAFPDPISGMGCPTTGCAGYELVADLDFDTDGSGSADAGDAYWNAGAGWAPLGSAATTFATTFEGNGYTVAHLFINRSDDAGLFGVSTSAIRHVGVVDASVTGASRVGGLVGQNIGAIVGSYVTGSVSGGTNVGGLVGFNLFGGVYASYATTVVSGATSVGGLVGGNFGIVTASYATGGVTGSGQVGGLAGQHVGVVAVSYATGRVLGDTEVGGLAGAGGGRVTASYWDQDTSGWTGAGAGSGQSTSALYGPTGYADLYAGWNVDVDSDGAADAPWHFGTAGQYPALVVDFDGDGAATWQEFGRQLREGPAIKASSPASGTPVEVSWTAADTSHWTPSPAVSYAVYRRAGDSEALVAAAVEGLSYTDAGAEAGVEYRYQVVSRLSGGEPSRSGAVAPNRWPETVGGLSALTLRIPDGAVTVDVSAAFRDADDDELTYGVVSSAPAVASVSMSSSVVTLTPLSAGVSTVTVTATDVAGSNTSARQQFVVTVANRSPEPVGTLSDRTLQIADGAVTVDVSGAFRDLDGDALTYGAVSSTPAVATVSVSSFTLTLTPLSAGVSTVTVTATDAAGSNTSARQQFVMTVANRPPEKVGTLSDRTLQIADGAVTVDVSGAFQDLDGDVLTYGAVSSSPAVATVSVSSSTLTLTLLTAGVSTVTVTATDVAGSNTSATQQFVVTVANRPPEPVGTLSDRTLQIADGASTVDVSGAFRDLDEDALTYGAVSSSPAVATVSVSSSTLTLTPLTAGVSTVTVTATDVGGSNTPARQQFMVTVEGGAAVDYDADDDGLIEVATLAQLDAVRHDLDGDGAATETGATAYEAAYPDPVSGMGCPAAGCAGYELVADLDFDTDGSGSADAGDAYWNAGAGWVPLGSAAAAFATTFEGNGHTVAHLFINRSDDAGLFGVSTSAIRHVGVVDAAVTGASRVGGLVGQNIGAIVGSYVTGSVSGGTNVGGLVGFNLFGGVYASYATAVVSGETSVGGLVGGNFGIVSASYATGGVAGAGQVGGLAGQHVGVVAVSYSTGRVSGDTEVGGLAGAGRGRVTASYWDQETSDWTGAGAGAGQSTSALQGPTGYAGLYAGWDVDGDGAADAAWHFGTAGQYPALAVDFDGDGQATWQEFGRQLREGPAIKASSPAKGTPVEVSWTAVDTSHWTPSPAVTYAVYRRTGDTEALVAAGVEGLSYTDTGAEAGIEYRFQVAVVLAGGEPSRSGAVAPNLWPETVGGLSAVTLRIAAGAVTVDVSGAFRDADDDELTYGVVSSAPAVASVSISNSVVTLTPLTAGVSTVTVTATDVAGSNTSASQQFVVTVANRAPEPVGTLSDRTLEIVDGAVTVDVSGAFRDLDGDALTYGAASSSPTVATVSVSNSTVTLTPLSAGVTTVTVTATDAAGSNTSASQQFEVTVEAGGPFDYDADDDGLIEIATLAQLDAVRHDLDGDGAPTETGATAYAAAFPDPISGMGCPATGCAGYELVADLDFDTDGSGSADAGDAYWNAGAGWVPLGSAAAAFATTFEGNGHTVAHLFINRGADAGLFGVSTSAIRHVGVVDASVTGTSRVGGLVGQSTGTIHGSYATGRVSGGTNVGGLVGFNIFGGVYASYATAVVSGATSVGGLVGGNFGWVSASYATGGVTGSGKVGGLAGQHLGMVAASYATGRVSGDTEVGGLTGAGGGRVTASYWDQETSGRTGAGSGSGQSTSALQGPTGYTGLYAGWDVDVDGDGSADAPWDFGTSSEYPALSVDANGDGAATWRELGQQGRPAGSATSGVRRGAGMRSWGASFSDDPLRPGVTPVRAVHLLELRARVDGLRARAGLAASGWTDATIRPGATPARAVHVTELRKALAAAYAAAGRPAPGYTDPVVTAGATVLRAAHLTELRAAVVALEKAPALRTDQ